MENEVLKLATENRNLRLVLLCELEGIEKCDNVNIGFGHSLSSGSTVFANRNAINFSQIERLVVHQYKDKIKQLDREFAKM